MLPCSPLTPLQPHRTLTGSGRAKPPPRVGVGGRFWTTSQRKASTVPGALPPTPEPCWGTGVACALPEALVGPQEKQAECTQSQVLGSHPYTGTGCPGNQGRWGGGRSAQPMQAGAALPCLTLRNLRKPHLSNPYTSEDAKATLPSCGLCPYYSMRATGRTTELCQSRSHFEYRKDVRGPEHETRGEAAEKCWWHHLRHRHTAGSSSAA